MTVASPGTHSRTTKKGSSKDILTFFTLYGQVQNERRPISRARAGSRNEYKGLSQYNCPKIARICIVAGSQGASIQDTKLRYNYTVLSRSTYILEHFRAPILGFFR